MTKTNLQVEMSLGIRGIYPDAVYDVPRVGEHLVAMHSAWTHCLFLALFRASRADPQATPIHVEHRVSPSLGAPSWQRAEATYRVLTPAARTLAIRHLRLGSPMDLNLAVQGGVTAVSVYAIHLLAHVLRDPERVGSRWHKGMAQIHTARQERERLSNLQHNLVGEDRAVNQLITTASELSPMQPLEVIVEGAGPVPPDLQDKTTS